MSKIVGFCRSRVRNPLRLQRTAASAIHDRPAAADWVKRSVPEREIQDERGHGGDCTGKADYHEDAAERDAPLRLLRRSRNRPFATPDVAELGNGPEILARLLAGRGHEELVRQDAVFVPVDDVLGGRLRDFPARAMLV